MNARLSYRAWMPWLIACTILFGLFVDQIAGVRGQIAVSIWTVMVLALLFTFVPATERFALVLCLLIATFGEVVLSLGWGLYTYRLHNIPFFVPPGHVLLFWLGMQLTWRLPYAVLRAVAPVSTGLIVALAFTGDDWLSVPLLCVFLLCWRFGPSPRLYAIMFVLSLIMELYGTWIGNWAWHKEVPGLGWPTMNPPLAAGAFYCVLDLLVMVLMRLRGPIKESID